MYYIVIDSEGIGSC